MPGLCRGSLCALGALAALAAVATLAQRKPTSSSGSVSADVLAPETDPEVRRRQELIDRLVAAQARIRRRQDLARRLIAGQTTLLWTAAWFCDLDTSLPSFRWGDFRAHYPGATDAERFCWKVIRYVELALCDDPERARDVACRLEAELYEQRQHGPLELPRPPLPQR